MAELKLCPFDNRNCFDCENSGKIEHSVYLCTGFVGDLDEYLRNQYRRGGADNG